MPRVITDKQKELIFRFHIKDATMTELANELGVAPKVAYDVYKQFIVDIIKDFKRSGYVNITYGSKPAPRTIPEPQPRLPPEDDDEGDDDEDEPEEEEDDVPAEEDDEEQEAKEKAQKKVDEEPASPAVPPKVRIPAGIVSGLADEERPIIIEKNTYAVDVGMVISGGDDVAEIQKPDELPEIAIAARGIIEKIKEPFVFIRPVFHPGNNTVTIEIDEFGDE